MSSSPPALSTHRSEAQAEELPPSAPHDRDSLLGQSWQEAVQLVESIAAAAAVLGGAGRVGYANAEAARQGLTWRDFLATTTEQQPPWMPTAGRCSLRPMCLTVLHGGTPGVQLTIPVRLGSLRLDLCVLAQCPQQEGSAQALHKPLRVLAPRQARVARLMLCGLSDKEISAQLGLSYHTVRTYVRQVLGRFSVHSRGELICLVLREGVTGPDSSSP